jgi:pyruvate dehydrogenase E2 component (dihydrolipoamide acetyltransferase)
VSDEPLPITYRAAPAEGVEARPELAPPPGEERELRDFVLPDLGEGLEDATVVEWLVAPGDRVALNQTLCTVETAKANVDVPSPFDGVVVELGGAENDTIPVGALLVRIAVAPGSVRESGGGSGSEGTEGAGAGPTLVGYGPESGAGGTRRRARAVAPLTATANPATAAAASPGPTGDTGPIAKPLARPPVRKLARDLGVDLRSIAPGSGPRGIVTRADVLAVGTRPGAAAPIRATAGAEPVATPGDVVPLRGVRARIAEHMVVSRASIPDATCTVVVDCSRLLALRGTMNVIAERRGDPPSVTPFAIMCWLLVRALRAVPTLNAKFVDAIESASGAAEIHLHPSVHLGIGTATDRGLVVPVARDAERRSWYDLASDIARLAAGARDGTLAPAELVGSTFTVSNFGALGLDEGIPVINHPEAAILGIGAIKLRPYVVDGVVVARSTASLTLAFDHRVADGADAGRLLSTMRELVEAPELALLDS